jgi:hypothetical protein
MADRLLVYIQSDVIHSLRGASEVVLWISLIAESSLSQHFVLLLDLAFKQTGSYSFGGFKRGRRRGACGAMHMIPIFFERKGGLAGGFAARCPRFLSRTTTSEFTNRSRRL